MTIADEVIAHLCRQTLQTAAGLYQGEFLAGFALVDSPAFEEWLFLQRERLHLLVSEAYRDSAAYAEAHGDLTGAVAMPSAN